MGLGRPSRQLESIGVGQATVIGHSTGGMLAMRYALMYPQQTAQLALVLASSADKIRSYERATYYVGTWRPEYERWVQMLAGLNRGPGKPQVAWNSALIYDMIFTQPVVYELGALKTPTLLLIGDKDTTAIAKDAAPPEVRARVGNYAVLGKLTAKTLPDAKLVEFPELGHAPQIQDPQAFHKALLDGLAALPAGR